ncbi:MAG TPA: hypothetical protein VFZ42_16010 [Chitinophagaceae bacterium]
MRHVFLIALFVFHTLVTLAQDTVLVVEKSIRIASLTPVAEYYGFAKGDKVIFNVWVEKGKELKDFTVTEYPNSIKFAEHTVEKIENKTLDIPRNSIYRLEYNNSNILPRVVNIRILRIPADKSTRAFNTNVKWVDRTDTTFRAEQTGYEMKSDTAYQEVLNTSVKVNFKSSADNTHRKLVEFILPANTIRWAYWIGVGEKGKEAYELDKKKFSEIKPNKAGDGPLVGVAMGNASMTQIKVGENMRYYFISKQEETQKFMNGASFGQFRQGDMVVDYGLMNYSNKESKQYYIGLSNDNPALSPEVAVRIIAVTVVKGYETKGENIPILSTSRVPVHEQ